MLTDPNIEMVLGIPFLTFSKVDIQFDTESFTLRFCIIVEVLSTAKQIELIYKHKIAKTTLKKNSKTFVMHVIALDVSKPTMPIHLSQSGQVIENNSVLVMALQ